MIRRLFGIAALTLMLGVPMSALAQETTPAAGAESSGSPIYGYLAFAALGGLTLAILCRSSRRS